MGSLCRVRACRGGGVRWVRGVVLSDWASAGEDLKHKQSALRPLWLAVVLAPHGPRYGGQAVASGQLPAENLHTPPSQQLELPANCPMAAASQEPQRA
jgi:hypothetical protein